MGKRNLQNILNEFTASTIGDAARHFGQEAILNKTTNFQAAFSEAKEISQTPGRKQELRELVGKYQKFPETVGGHPDFDYLKHGQSEQHYIVSVFADIKGSTKLATKLPLIDVRKIKNGALTTMIDIFQAFDGHIHRLQGDGLLAFFGRKSVRRSQAIVDALNAASFLQHFFQHDLRPLFERHGYPPIHIRVGIDFGDDAQVLWSRYGIRYCDEVTTTSLHTDLAAKLQSRAKSSGVMIGDNVRKFLDFPDEFYNKKQITKEGQLVEDDYVFRYSDNYYRMWELDWERYLGRFLFNPSRLGVGTYKAGEHFTYNCYFKDGDSWQIYTPNCFSLKKGVDLKFEVDNIVFPYHSIQWRVLNRGEEAKNERSLDYVMDNYKGKRICNQETAYTGHHYMVCTIDYQRRNVATERIGVYINDA